MSVGGREEAAVGAVVTGGPGLLPFLQSLYLDTMQALEDLLKSILQRNMTPQGLQLMVEVCDGVPCQRVGTWRPILLCFLGPSLPRGGTGAIGCFLQLGLVGRCAGGVGPHPDGA